MHTLTHNTATLDRGGAGSLAHISIISSSRQFDACFCCMWSKYQFKFYNVPLEYDAVEYIRIALASYRIAPYFLIFFDIPIATKQVQAPMCYNAIAISIHFTLNILNPMSMTKS